MEFDGESHRIETEDDLFAYFGERWLQEREDLWAAVTVLPQTFEQRRIRLGSLQLFSHQGNETDTYRGSKRGPNDPKAVPFVVKYCNPRKRITVAEAPKRKTPSMKMEFSFGLKSPPTERHVQLIPTIMDAHWMQENQVHALLLLKRLLDQQPHWRTRIVRIDEVGFDYMVREYIPESYFQTFPIDQIQSMQKHLQALPSTLSTWLLNNILERHLSRMRERSPSLNMAYNPEDNELIIIDAV